MSKIKQFFVRNKKKILIGLGVFLGLLLVAFTIFFLNRERLLQYAVKKVVQKVENRYPADLQIGKAQFKGLATVLVTDISFVPENQPKLLQIDTVEATVSVRSLFLGRLVFKQFDVANGDVTAFKQDSVDNFSFLYKKKATGEEEKTKDAKEKSNYGTILNRLIETAFENVPDGVNFRNLGVIFQNNGRTISMRLPTLTVEDGQIQGRMAITTDSITNTMYVNGVIDPDEYLLAAKMYAEKAGGIQVPYIQQKFGATMRFDTLSLSITDKVFKNDQLTITGESSAHGLVLNHPKIADEDVFVKNGALKYVITLGNHYYSLDTLSEVRVNKAVFYPQLTYETRPNRKIGVKIDSPNIPANDLFESMPPGLFDTFQGMRANGSFKYHMDFYVDMAKVDSLTFNSDLDGQNLEITQFGEQDLRKINREFEHTVYENGKPTRTFLVGPSNPNFTPYNQISNYLKNAILTAEDPRFFTHKGFHEGAFRHSLITNIKEGSFVRGGSTVAMQLVKNVYLTRKKTITRKVEEALIVWLIENLNLSTKQRMYEVYLNIIEWGPNVYGVKEGAQFYFSKRPSELTLEESMFMASIVPKPKQYRTYFNQYGELRAYPRYFFNLISGNMLKRGLISPSEHASVSSYVNLNGRAGNFIMAKPDTTQIMDTLQLAPIDLLDF